MSSTNIFKTLLSKFPTDAISRLQVGFILVFITLMGVIQYCYMYSSTDSQIILYQNFIPIDVLELSKSQKTIGLQSHENKATIGPQRHESKFCQNCKRAWKFVGENRNWSVVFVNHFPKERRMIEIIRLYKKSQLLIIQNTEETSCGIKYLPSKWKYFEKDSLPIRARIYQGGAPGADKVYEAAYRKLNSSISNQGYKRLKREAVKSAILKMSGIESKSKSTNAINIKKWKNDDCYKLPYFPLLLSALAATDGAILELGVSKCSTDLIHYFAEKQNRFALSADSNTSIIKTFKHNKSKRHQYFLVPYLKKTKTVNGLSKKRRVWISFGICHSFNTKANSKGSYPYAGASLLSTNLWLNMATSEDIRVHIYVAHVSNDTKVWEYIRTLEELGAVATPMEVETKDCVIVSQWSRMFAYRVPDIRDDDIIITADIDAFPASVEILKPIKVGKPVNIWNYLFCKNTGSYFPMSFISMNRTTWKYAIGCDSSVPGCIKEFSLLHLEQSEWFFDQAFITYRILTKKLCSIKRESIFKRLKIPYQTFDDSKLCGHYNIGNIHQMANAYWFHFRPIETLNEMTETYYELRQKIKLSAKKSKIFFR